MDSDESKQPLVGEPAGQQLRKAREKLGLSVEDIASAQHLRPSIIQSIEATEYEQIDSELFLKGYVRAYAKQIGADADHLIEVLDQELEPLREQRERQAEENPLVDIERRRLRKRRIVKTLFILIVLGGGAFAAWKYVIEPQFRPATSGGAAPGVEAGDAADQIIVEREEPVSLEAMDSDQLSADDVSSADPVTVDRAVDVPAESTEDPSASESVNDESLAATLVEEDAPTSDETPSQAPDFTDSDADVAVSAPITSDEVVESQSSGVAVERVEPDLVISESVELAETSGIEMSNTVSVSAAEPTLPSAAGAGQLMIDFGADCWVQVTDATGRSLVSSLQRDGDRVNVTGQAPLNVVIGAVDAVESLSFDGERVELSSFRVVKNRTEFILTL